MAAPERVYIGLGSNLENPLGQVQRALDELATLPQTSLVSCSRYYQSAAVGPGDQPDYINAVACLDTRLSPEDLLDALQHVEQNHGRVRRETWGPRTLDLDILLYGNRVLETERLQIPHPWLSRRAFVILPLADVAEGLILPDGTALNTLVHQIDRAGIRCLDICSGTVRG